MIKIYDTLFGKKKIFKPIAKKSARLFVCGPTVYDFSHIGHARTYVAFDVIVKYLRRRGYDVFYLQNITDLDDKIINRAKELGVNPKNLASRFEKNYYEDMKAINVNSVSRYARATDYVYQIIKQTEVLMKKGFAYVAANGSVYFDISKFKDYGKLSKRTVLQAEDAVSRIDEAVEKKNKGDFVLWKISKPDEPKWESPRGEGRPGWHIEDTAITEKYFGPQYDIHGGARDLMFPHHEAEIAQMESASGKKPLARFWMHTGFLLVSGEKMSKSLGNFIAIRDFLKKYSPEILRFMILGAHYRSSLDYNENLVKQAKAGLERIGEFLEKLNLKSQIFPNHPRAFGASGQANLKITSQKSKIILTKLRKEFYQAMDDDFNTPKAIAAIFNLIKRMNPLIDKNQISRKESRLVINFFNVVDEIFKILSKKKNKTLPDEIKKLAAERETLRKLQKWAEADEIRKKIEESGYMVEDTTEGPKIKLLTE